MIKSRAILFILILLFSVKTIQVQALPFFNSKKPDTAENNKTPELEKEEKKLFFRIPFLKSLTKKGTRIDKDLKKKDTDPFSKGYDQFEEKDYESAIQYLHAYLKSHTPDDPDYEWAEFFFGVSLAKMGLSHASVDALSHLVSRNPNP